MRIGLLGAGQVALEHARAAAALGHEIAAVSSRSGDSPRLAKFLAEFPSARRAETAAVLADRSLGAVVACLPWDETHRRLGELLSSPLPVLIEKPAALSSAALERALKRAPKKGPIKAVGYNRRFYEPVARVKERLSHGGLKAAELTVSEDAARHVERQGAAIVPHLEAFCSHGIDLALFLLGPLAVRRAYAARAPHDRGFLSRHALLETRRGVPVWLAFNANDPTTAGLLLRFDDGSAWRLSPLETLRVYAGFEIVPPEPGRRIRRYEPRLLETVEADSELKPGFTAQLRDFLGGRAGTLATLRESVALLKLIEALKRAR